MITNFYINGKVEPMLLQNSETERDEDELPPIFHILRDQAERIARLEKQNQSLVKQGETLLDMIRLSGDMENLLEENIKGIVQRAIEEEKET